MIFAPFLAVCLNLGSCRIKSSPFSSYSPLIAAREATLRCKKHIIKNLVAGMFGIQKQVMVLCAVPTVFRPISWIFKLVSTRQKAICTDHFTATYVSDLPGRKTHEMANTSHTPYSMITLMHHYQYNRLQARTNKPGRSSER